jgi:glycosyltransferase involved in cell wall biosynthesis
VRILHCIDTLGGGGAERQLAALLPALVRMGHDVDLVYLLDGTYTTGLRDAGPTLHRLGPRSPVTLVSDVYRIIREHRVQLVQTWLQRMSVAGGVASMLARRPWIYSERSVRAHDRGWRATVRRRLAVHASAIAANSETGAEDWRLSSGAAVRVLPNGIDFAAIDAVAPAARGELGIAADAEVVSFIGRFVPPKNIPLLTETVIRVLGARPRAVALLLGDGPELAGLRAAVERAGLGARCHTPGFRGDVWRLMKIADVLLAPSTHEGRPNAVLEAAAAGCPLLLSRIDAHRECMPLDAALWFSPDAPDEAIAAVASALDDRPAARRRAERARHAVRGQSIDAMARAYDRLYRELVG